MFKSILIKTALLSMMLGSLGASANTTVDLFSDVQGIQSVNGGIVSNIATGPDIIGGERDILINSGNNVQASTQVIGGELIIASNLIGGGSDTTFIVEVQWDGVDGLPTVSTSPGILPAADFSTLNGFSATVNHSDGNGFFEIFLYNALSEMTTVLLPFSPVTYGSPETFSIPFAFFAPGIVLTEIVAIVLRMTSNGATDINVSSITAVPAPSSLAVLGLGLLAFTGFARRKA
jgi:hypothetical protein